MQVSAEKLNDKPTPVQRFVGSSTTEYKAILVENGDSKVGCKTSMVSSEPTLICILFFFFLFERILIVVFREVVWWI